MEFNVDSFFVFGFSYHQTDISVRDELARLVKADNNSFLKKLKMAASLREIVLISTCNRFEIVMFADLSNQTQENIITKVIDFLNNESSKQLNLQNESYFVKSGLEAYRYLSLVTASIDSMVQGEAQIFGQVKKSYKDAFESGTVGRFLHHVFQTIFKTTKSIRSNTHLGAQSLSVAAISVKLIEQFFSNLKNLNILLLGSGEIAELALMHLTAKGCENITILNRSVSKADNLAKRFNVRSGSLDLINELLNQSDVVIGSLRIDKPILSMQFLKSIKLSRPLVFIDLGIPRNFQSSITELDDMFCYDIEALKEIAEKHKSSRQDAVKDAELIIDYSIFQFERWLNYLKHEPWKISFRETIREICKDEATKVFSDQRNQQEVDMFYHKVSQKIALEFEAIFEDVNLNSESEIYNIVKKDIKKCLK